MLYNGFIINIKCFFILYCVLYQNNIFINSQTYFSKICFNDTLILQYIMSSSVITIWVLFLLSLFIFKHTSMFIFIIKLVVIFYMFNSNIIDNNVNFYFKTTVINTQLQNGLVFIHPLIIYYMYLTTMHFYMRSYCVYTNIELYFNKNITIYSCVLIIIFGIFLGSFWAAQELNWGGFWSWDPVEMISLIVLFYLLNEFHKKNNYSYIKNLTYIYITVFVIYGILRLGAANTVHSFINSKQIPLLFIIIVVLLNVMFLYRSIIIIKNRTIVNNKQTDKYMHNLNTKFMIISVYLFITIFTLNTLIIKNYIYVYTYISGFNLLNPEKYIIVIILYMYSSTIFVGKETTFVLRRNTILLILVIILCETIEFFLVVLFLTIQKNIKKSKYIHVILVTLYLFLNYNYIYLNEYTQHTNFIKLISKAYNSMYLSINENYFYESNLYVLKKQFFKTYKSIITHVTGFSLLTNFYSTTYLFCKNYNLFYLHSTEFIIILTIIFALTTANFIKIQIKIEQKT